MSNITLSRILVSNIALYSVEYQYFSRNVRVLECTDEQLGELYRGEQPVLAEQAAEDLQVRRVLHSPGEERLRPHRGLLLPLGQRDGRKLHCEMGEQDHLLHSQCLWTGHVKAVLPLCI